MNSTIATPHSPIPQGHDSLTQIHHALYLCLIILLIVLPIFAALMILRKSNRDRQRTVHGRRRLLAKVWWSTSHWDARKLSTDAPYVFIHRLWCTRHTLVSSRPYTWSGSRSFSFKDLRTDQAIQSRKEMNWGEPMMRYPLRWTRALWIRQMSKCL